MPTKTTTDKQYKQWMELNEKFGPRSTFEKCPHAMEWVRFDTIALALIVPEGLDADNGVRAMGINQDSVNAWKRRIESNKYNPIKYEPPVVTELAPSSALYKKGYRYRLLDGHHRKEALAQLDVESLRVQVVQFRAYDGKSSEYWRIAFMAEKNDPENDEFFRLPSSSDDKVQTAKLLVATSSNVESADDTAQMQMDEAKRLAAEIAKDIGVTTKKEREEILNTVLRTSAEKNADIRNLIVRTYVDYQMKKQTATLCKTKKLSPENGLVRKFYVGDPFCSRFDYDQLSKLLAAGMSDVADLKRMFIVGQVADHDSPEDVVRERKRKIRMVEEFVTFIEQAAEWLTVEKNRTAICNVPFYWAPQVAEDGDTGLFQINPKTGKRK
jgi:hypothetical protein